LFGRDVGSFVPAVILESPTINVGNKTGTIIFHFNYNAMTTYIILEWIITISSLQIFILVNKKNRKLIKPLRTYAQIA
jgi:hypothetical protein